MSRSLAAAVALCGALYGSNAACPAQSAPPLRTRQRLDADWRFQRRDDPRASITAGEIPVTNWRWIPDDNGPSDAAKMADPGLDASGPEWKDASSGEDIFRGRIGSAWLRVNLTPLVQAHGGKAPLLIHFESVDDEGTVYLNGKMLTQHAGWSDAFDVPLASAWRSGGANILSVLVKNTAGAGGIGGPVSLAVGKPITPAEASAGFSDAGWRVVHLPHDFVVEGTFQPKASGSRGFLPSGAAWYRKHFTIPASAKGKSVWLDFGGVYRDSRVWINGHYLGEHPCGYTGFRYDISPLANFGRPNVLAVFVDARKPEGWWYEGGGIYRHVWLNIANPLRVASDGTFVSSRFKGRTAGQRPSAEIVLKTTLTNESERAKACTLSSTILRPDGTTLPTAIAKASVPAGGTIDVAQTVTEPAARLWSLEAPRLYRLHTVVSANGRPLDRYDTPFGVRSIRFDADKGFFLNEKAVKIKGTCNHQDFAGIGVALPDGILAWRVKKLKEMGSNAYRTSHNEVAAELLDACDRQGMLVMDETRHFGDGEGGKASDKTPASDLSNLRQQVLQDRNHPSVIMWSIGNEEGAQGSPGGLRIGTAMKKAIDELDGSRPVSEAINSAHGAGSSTAIDLEGFNYNPRGYDPYHRDHPGHPLYGSETASALSTRGIYTVDTFKYGGVTEYGVEKQGWVAAYDVNRPGWGQTAEDAWRPIAERPYVAGGFVWTGFDYRGEPTPFGWPCINSAFGIMDMCGFPKDSYYYYQSVWGNKPMVHILPHWNWPGKEGKPIDVWAYSTADRVELFLNGTSLGLRDVPKNGHASWSVLYKPGTLLAKAEVGGQVAATDRVETTGAPAGLRLTTDRKGLAADGEDQSPIAVAVVDAQGRLVPTADNLITFHVSGPAHVAGVGNGDPSSHEPDKASQRHAFNGLCMVMVEAGDRPGAVRVTAQCAGLSPATLLLTVVRPVVPQPRNLSGHVSVYRLDTFPPGSCSKRSAQLQSYPRRKKI